MSSHNQGNVIIQSEECLRTWSDLDGDNANECIVIGGLLDGNQLDGSYKWKICARLEPVKYIDTITENTVVTTLF